MFMNTKNKAMILLGNESWNGWITFEIKALIATKYLDTSSERKWYINPIIGSEYFEVMFVVGADGIPYYA